MVVFATIKSKTVSETFKETKYVPGDNIFIFYLPCRCSPGTKKSLVSEADLINGSGVKTCRILFVVSTVKSQNASLLFPQNAWRQRNHS